MPTRFHKRIQLGKFIRLNISKTGFGVSVGVKGLRFSIGPRGARLTAGVPGSGWQYIHYFNSDSDPDSDSADAKSDEKEASKAQKLQDLEEKIDKEVEEEEAKKLEPIPEPGLLASATEKELVKGINGLRNNKPVDALGHFLEAAPEEPGAAIVAASMLKDTDLNPKKAITLLEGVVQSNEEFPTSLMEKYMSTMQVPVDITPRIIVAVPVGGLAATLLLVEFYQARERVSEAIALLEEVEELVHAPILKLSLVELYADAGIWDGVIEHGKGVEVVDNITLAIVIYYGRAMQHKDLHDAALSVFTPALRKRKGRSPELIREGRYWRALTYKALGKKKRANKEFEKLYAEEPDFRDIAERLGVN